MKKPKGFIALGLAFALGLQSGVLALFSQNYAVPPEGAPIAQELEFTTYCDIAYQGQLLAVDSQGDDITYTVDTAAKKGTVELDGTAFIYTPIKGKSGSDRFTYIAIDSQGNCSAPATVLVNIEKVKSDVTYADTTPVEAAAAQYLAEEGVFAGTKIGENYYLEPTRTVSRSEFLAMAMEVVGVEIATVSITSFCDDSNLNAATKNYVATAVMAGYVQGVPTQDGVAFQGAETITFSEASAMLSRVLGVEDVDLAVWYGQTVVNHWADQAVGNLEAIDVVAVGSFGSEILEEPLARSQAVVMLAAAGQYLDSQETGLLDWLF
ncbi:Ig-like domain-containing protein [Bengtsoniella intestinalis]|uniref:Ig-like domain-containing protein n=1 Tax=Bengtsoniella intestinalis TaxID=3073143 RepID=UPI00391F012B